MTTTNAHGDHDIFYTPTLTLKQGVSNHAGAAHAIGMTHRNRTAIHIQFIVVDAQLIATVEHLHSKRLIQLP